MSDKRIALAAWLLASVLWAGALGGWFWAKWPDHVAPVEAQYVGRESFCGARYNEPAARERCVIIMDLERFQTRSIMMFNRGLALLGPPLIGLGLILYLLRSRTPRPRPPAGNRRR